MIAAFVAVCFAIAGFQCIIMALMPEQRLRLPYLAVATMFILVALLITWWFA